MVGIGQRRRRQGCEASYSAIMTLRTACAARTKYTPDARALASFGPGFRQITLRPEISGNAISDFRLQIGDCRLRMPG